MGNRSFPCAISKPLLMAMEKQRWLHHRSLGLQLNCKQEAACTETIVNNDSLAISKLLKGSILNVFSTKKDKYIR
jgi:hypothetical protein